VYSPTWLFHVPARSASTGVDSSFHPHFDANADGFDDMVVGAQGGLAPAFTGAAVVYLGSASGVVVESATTLTSPSAMGGGGFGTLVSCAGDLNGDGYADLVVTTPGDHPDPTEPSATNTVSIFFGGSSGISTTTARVLVPADGGWFGVSVAGMGDVNGDGYGDLAVSGRYIITDPQNFIHIFHGSATGVPVIAATGFLSSFYIDTRISSYPSLAPAGDVNGDGYNDLIVGVTDFTDYDHGGVEGGGVARVFYGSRVGIVSTTETILNGLETYAGFGNSVAGAGDFNGDGYSDVVVGAPTQHLRDLRLVGTVSVFRGSATGIVATTPTELEGTTESSAFGKSVANAGDINGDGYADLVVGAPSVDQYGRPAAPGTAHVFLGGAGGIATSAARSLASGSIDPDLFGVSVTGASDLNADGYADLVVGAPMFPRRVFVYHGSLTGISSVASRILEGEADDFGSVIARFDTPNGGQHRMANFVAPFSHVRTMIPLRFEAMVNWNNIANALFPGARLALIPERLEAPTRSNVRTENSNFAL
jgi:hypothetical protein